jgi:glutamyl-tRNA reductase
MHMLVAVTHQHTPFATLERVALDAASAQALADALRAAGGVNEAVVLSTCNRIELYLAGARPDAGVALDTLAAHTGVASAELRQVAVVASGDDASRHLFRVAAGLESRVVGEGEILGQVRIAVARAEKGGTAGPELSSLFRWAAATGRRARRAAGELRPSLARTAIDAVTAPAMGRHVLVLGAGAMATALTAELASRHQPYRVCARRPERATRLTRRASDVAPLTALGDELERCDVLICATGARTPIVTRDTITAAMAHRPQRPLTILDLSMPRNVAPTVSTVAGLRLIDLEHLTAEHGDLHLRRALQTVTAEHDRYRTWLAGRATGELIAALHAHVNGVCRAEADRLLSADRGEGGDPAKIARAIAGKLLHGPTLAIKELSARGDEAGIAAIAAAFNLGPITSYSIRAAS